MKTLLSLRLWLAALLLAVSSASSASTIWESTDGDSNFLSISLFGLPSSETFGIFAANADLNTAAPLYSFTGIGSYTATGSFKLGLWDAGKWLGEAANGSLLGNMYLLSFAKTSVPTNNLVLLYGFDIKPAANQGGGSVVPLPASIWFMTSALLGFLYTGRRKTLVQA
ncbi:hypothetical protein ACH518_17375 [Methylomonas sp. HW2-6]|uniref:hypothetical protein n=1 Tax=Methylomonas sp. HW2-6 TaxID=3376687 RepID=UPI0040422EA7